MLIEQELPNEVKKLQMLNRKVVSLTALINQNYLLLDLRFLKEDCERLLKEMSKIAHSNERFKRIKTTINENPKLEEAFGEAILRLEMFTPIFLNVSEKDLMNSPEVIKLKNLYKTAYYLVDFAKMFDIFERDFLGDSLTNLAKELQSQIRVVESFSYNNEEIEKLLRKSKSMLDSTRLAIFIRPFF